MLYSINLILVSVLFKLSVITWLPQYFIDSAWASFAEMVIFLGITGFSFSTFPCVSFPFFRLFHES